MSFFELNTVEDLVFNTSFRQWVLLREKSVEYQFWVEWVAQHPEKKLLINQSKAVIYALQINSNQLSEEEINQEIEHILQKVNNQSNWQQDERDIFAPGFLCRVSRSIF